MSSSARRVRHAETRCWAYQLARERDGIVRLGCLLGHKVFNTGRSPIVRGGPHIPASVFGGGGGGWCSTFSFPKRHQSGGIRQHDIPRHIVVPRPFRRRSGRDILRRTLDTARMKAPETKQLSLSFCFFLLGFLKALHHSEMACWLCQEGRLEIDSAPSSKTYSANTHFADQAEAVCNHSDSLLTGRHGAGTKIAM
ncbi:hypothetical protein LY76DRAFT_236148 [Colletotrichum caudatum]|nr:hypothetical protein LY76DRAFT_236148 [Colletotrichum caudatum]